MIKKVIALVFVSFFVMSGLTVLNENNQNYNIFENNINSFTSSSFSPLTYSINQSITFSKSISSSNQIFGCYNNVLYYINTTNIMSFNLSNQKISIFLTLINQPYQLEIYNNYMIISYGKGSGDESSSLINIYNFSSKILYNFDLTNLYNYTQFAMINNNMYMAGIYYTGITIYSIILNPISTNTIATISISQADNQFAVAGYNNNVIFASNSNNYGGPYPLNQLAYLNILTESINTSTSNSGNYFGNIYSIIDLGNYGILGSQSYFIRDNNTAGTTQYSFNPYDSGLFFSDSNYKNLFIPINSSNNVFSKLPTLNNNSNYQYFCDNGTLKCVYLPIGSSNNIFNSLTYIINGNKNLFIVNNNNLYVYPFYKYYLDIKSFNKFNNQIKNYFLYNGKIYNDFSNNFIFSTFPQIFSPLNTSTYYYNGSAIIIIQSDFSGSGSNLYYNLSIYYNQVQAPSIPLYNIFTYMYPISIIGLFVGMGAFISTIKKRGYKI